MRVVPRRRALTCVALSFAWPATVRAQGGRTARVGFASWFAPSETGQIEPLRDALRELGWVEGRNLELEVHFTEGDAARTRAALESFARRRFDVIVVRATNAAHIAKEVTTTIPIVMLVSDPLATGLVTSLARPEGNLTGLSLQGPDLAGKRLEYLRAIMPGVRTVGFLGASNDPNVSTFVRETRAAAERTGVDLKVRLVAGVRAFGEADVRALAEDRVQALLVQPIFTGQHERIVSLAMRERIPVISNYEVFARAGALLAYGPDDAALTRRAGWYVHRLLNGAKPGDLPVEQPSRFTLALNVATARALGLTVPTGLMTSADLVVE
jgi:putative ABC transport system substrate-binding protein